MDIQKMISEELSVKEKQVAAAVELLDAGNTVPFIARYRKEATGGLDDEALRRLSERLTYLRNLEKRKEEVRALIAAQGQLTDEIDAAKLTCENSIFPSIFDGRLPLPKSASGSASRISIILSADATAP